MTRNDDIDVRPKGQINWRWEIANNNGSKLFISFHLDDTKSEKMFAVYQQDKGNSDESIKLGNVLMSNLAKSGAQIDAQPVKTALDATRFQHLGVLNNFNGKAGVLIEFGGIKSANNRYFINTNAMQMGYTLALGIAQYLGKPLKFQ